MAVRVYERNFGRVILEAKGLIVRIKDLNEIKVFNVLTEPNS